MTPHQTAPHPRPLGATALGFPRIGRRRELKTALDRHWAGDLPAADLLDVATSVRRDAIAGMQRAGLDSVPINTFSLYDHLLDTTVMVGAEPERFRDEPDPLARYFAMARGSDRAAPLEMTKWFDTNYHVLVPEIGPSTTFTGCLDKVLAEHAEALREGADARPVLVGPFTYLRLAKSSEGDGFDPMSRLEDLTETYSHLLSRLHAAGVPWVQLDEPAAAGSLDDAAVAALDTAYRRLAGVADRPALLVAPYFGAPREALPVLAASGVEGLALDLTTTPTDLLVGLRGLSRMHLVAGVVDGRNVWRTDLRAALAAVTPLLGMAASVSVGTSCSLLHVPYDLAAEHSMDPGLRLRLAFADQKLAEVVALQRALTEGTDAVADELLASDTAAQTPPSVTNAAVRERQAAVRPQDRRRESADARVTSQRQRLDLPPLPTTTIGSFPQTPDVRRARARRRAGRLSDDAYRQVMRAEIATVVALQEELGLDVLVHGEPERNDMVQYFAELLDGYATTELGWVQSYGSRCVRPPILHGDVSRPAPMTVDWAAYAQSLTDRPVKGMLTGPVTMLAWSFVRDDQPLATTADQVALALRDEVADLEAAGIGIVQVDEPALRELLPVRAEEHADYLRWAVDAFRLATSGVAVSTQIHTHMCYAEFGDVIDAIGGLDADVTSLEAARSRMEVVAALAEHGFAHAVGPGVYDIHSPRVPEAAQVVSQLRAALATVGAERLWVNPDCGLKTRTYAQVRPALASLVEAARQVRAETTSG